MSRTVCALLGAAILFQPVGSMAFAAEPTAKALDCTRRYNEAMHMQETMAAMMKGMMPTLLEQERLRSGATMSAENQRLMTEAMAESSVAMAPGMMDLLGPVMAASFTEDEVCSMADFYSSARGQSIIAKMPAYTGKSMEAMREFLPLFQQDIQARFCRKVGCGAKATPAVRPS
ncbi:MAG: DUF2059 domain-containing protein [Caulobacter sp.]